MRSLLYLYDPLCGWCYAALPAITRLRDAGVSMTLAPTGLFSVPGRLMTADFASYAWENDQRIATLTRQPFSEQYRRQVLGAIGTAFDSSAATLALTAVALTEPTREFEALKLLQEARYQAGRDITDITTVRDVLFDAAFFDAAAALKVPTFTLLSANRARVDGGQEKMQGLGASGVPTLILIDGPINRLLDSKLLYHSSDALLDLFTETSASAK